MNPKQLKRRGPTRHPKDRILVVGTTPLHESYSRWILDNVDHHPGVVRVAEPDLSPEEVLRQAAKLARDQRVMGSECQQVWVVMDGITKDHALELETAASSRGVSLVSSTPDFRTWLVLHRADLAAQNRSGDLTEIYNSLLPEFERPFQNYAGDLVGQFQTAKTRAMSLPDDRISTDVHRLVDGILASAVKFQGQPTVGLI